MTIGINLSKFDQFANGGQIGAFYDLDGDGTLECVGLQDIYTEFLLILIRGVMTHQLLKMDYLQEMFLNFILHERINNYGGGLNLLENGIVEHY